MADLVDIVEREMSAPENGADSGASTEATQGADEKTATETNAAEQQTDGGEQQQDATNQTEPSGDGEGEKTADDSGAQDEGADDPADDQQKKDDTQDDKKQEMSDEDFEAEAKRRGFIKPDEKEQAEKEQRQQQDALAKLNERPQEVPEEQWNNMSPDNKIIYKSLPYIETVGKDGKVYRVKDSSQLPDDFEFADKKTELRFQNEFQAQELRAQDALNKLNSYRQQSQQRTAQVEESRQVIEGVAKLQKDGIIPQFTAKPNTPEFDKDPALVLVNEILAYRDERKKAGDNISVEDATYIFKAQHPEKFNLKKATTASDEQRKAISGKIGSPLGGKPEDGQLKPNLKGMSATQIMDYFADDLGE